MSIQGQQAMPVIRYRFVPMGAVAEPVPGRLYLDVGNRLEAGIIDHHQPDAPDRCTAALVLERPELVLAQTRDLKPGEPLEIIVHQGVDLDGISAIFLAEALLGGRLTEGAALWAEYVCRVDRGHTRLDPHRPITPYSVFYARLHLATTGADHRGSDAAGLAAIEAGKRLVAWIIRRLDAGVALDVVGDDLSAEPAFAPEVAFIRHDLARYGSDLARAERIAPRLPKRGGGREAVPGLWVERPAALLFKAWARGDAAGAGDPRGFVFIALAPSDHRIILSVQPDSGFWLKGLGEELEIAETEKRRRLGRERRGEPRPGYASPDPWYDGRSPLHGYTIVDAPNGGTLQTEREIREVFRQWVDGWG